MNTTLDDVLFAILIFLAVLAFGYVILGGLQ